MLPTLADILAVRVVVTAETRDATHVRELLDAVRAAGMPCDAV